MTSTSSKHNDRNHNAVDNKYNGNNNKSSSGPQTISPGGHNDTDDLTPTPPCLNPPSEINSRLDTQVEVKVYPCNGSNSNNNGRKKFTQFTVKPEGVIIQGSNRRNSTPNGYDLGAEYSAYVGRKLPRYELADTRACQLLVTSHAKSFWVVPAPETFSRHSGTCRLLGDRKHPPTPYTLQLGDFLRVGSVGVVVIELHDGVRSRALSEERIQRIMKDTAQGGNQNGGDTDDDTDSCDADVSPPAALKKSSPPTPNNDFDQGDTPICYMCFDDSTDDDGVNPLITPCKCLGDTRYVHVECLRKWHTAEADNQICFLSSVDATCSVCKSTFKSDFRLADGRLVKLFKSSLCPPYVSLLIATKHEMAQRLFNTRFQLSFSTLLKPDRRNGTRPLLLGRSSGSDMVLDYRTVSARHATIKFKNGEFIFADAGSSNGSYLYLRKPVELTQGSQSIQFRLGRSMISMRVVSKWNPHRRLLRAVARRTSGASSSNSAPETSRVGHFGSADIVSDSDDAEEYVEIVPDADASAVPGRGPQPIKKRTITREAILRSLPSPGKLAQTSASHLDLLHALAYPKRNTTNEAKASAKSTDPNKEVVAAQTSRIVSADTPVIVDKNNSSTSNMGGDTDVENNDEIVKNGSASLNDVRNNAAYIVEDDSFAAAAISLTPSLTDDVGLLHDLSNKRSNDENESAVRIPSNNEVDSSQADLAERRNLGIC